MNKHFAIGLTASLLATHVHAALTPPPEESTPNIDIRYRYENVQDDTIANGAQLRDANASTVRLRLGAQTKEFAGFSGKLVFEETNAIGGSERYNSGQNGLTELAGVSDPVDDSLDEGYVQYRWGELYIRTGRQFIQEGNGRLIGAANWRQNQTTFDAARVTYQGLPNTQLDLIYLDRATNAINAPIRFEGGYFQAAVSDLGPGTLRLQYLQLDFDDSSTTASRQDSSTWLLRYAGTVGLDGDWGIPFAAEIGQQTDFADSNDFEADYYRAELGVKFKTLYAKIGQESLGSDDGVRAFTTPIASNHGQNGWADVFLGGTPATGLVDTYIDIGANYGDFNWKIRYHDFASDEGSIDYGTELDVLAVYQILEPWSVGLKYSDYSADNNQVNALRVNNDLSKASIFTTLKF